MLGSLNQELVEFAFERAIGKNDSVYSNFVELIHQAKQKVGRIAIKKGNHNIGFATGFMVSENLLLTNWHVFKTIDEVVSFIRSDGGCALMRDGMKIPVSMPRKKAFLQCL
jgi:endonuclease G, mitochondrial